MTESQDEREGLPSASAFRRYELCAGSWQLEQEAKRLGQEAHQDSAAAQRGERIHAWLAGELDEDGSSIKLSESEQTTADFLQERAQDQAQRIFGDAKPEQLSEKRLWFMLKGQKVLSGRFDRVLWTGELALVQDFKTGFSEPDPAEQNSQMKVLAVLVAIHMPLVKEVVVQIVSGPFGVTEARYTMPELVKAYDSIVRTLRAIQDPIAALSPSLDACKLCAAINICQAVRNLSNPLTKLQVSALPEGGLRAAKLLDEVAVLQELIDSVKEHYSARLTADPAFDLPGYAMVPGNVRREVTDWEAARQRLGEWLELEDIEGAANYRLGDLEKALGKKLNLRGRELKERMNQILGSLLIEKENAASLKRVSKRGLVEVTLP